MLVDCFSLKKDVVDKLEINSSIFAVDKINEIAIASVIRWQLHARRQVLSFGKTRSDVKGSTKKIYRQKGTGNARHSDRYAPQFRGGGLAHGPKGTKKNMSIPKKVKKLALKHSLSAAFSLEKIFVYDSLEMENISTKDIVNGFSKFRNKKVLFIDSQSKGNNLSLSLSNVIGFNYLPIAGLNVYDLINSDIIIISSQSLPDLEKRVLS